MSLAEQLGVASDEHRANAKDGEPHQEENASDGDVGVGAKLCEIGP